MASALLIFQIDSFAGGPYKGNPAAVVPLASWLEDSVMQHIATENNLSETAFFVPKAEREFDIRWFTPMVEDDLCGHATLATAYVLFEKLGLTGGRIQFNSQKRGPLYVVREGDKIVLDFPSWPPKKLGKIPDALEAALGKPILGAYDQRDLLVELEDEAAVRRIEPDFGVIKSLGREVIVTARADGAWTGSGDRPDYVYRFFAPCIGIDEDPVTGSVNCELAPFWAARLGKTAFYARQLSRRGGELWCRLEGERVHIAGRCVLFMEGTIFLP